MGADILSGPLHHIITLSLMQETFPQTWKFSKVLPLHKKDDENTPKNYRPVSILSPMSKILERVIHDQLYKYFTNNKILNQNLHGYRKNRSSLTALLKMYDNWTFAASKGQISSAISLVAQKDNVEIQKIFLPCF